MSLLRMKKDVEKKDSRLDLLSFQELNQNSQNKINTDKKVGFQNWLFPRKKTQFEDNSDPFTTINRRQAVRRTADESFTRRRALRRRNAVESFSLTEGDLTELFTSVSVESEKDEADGAPSSGIPHQMWRALDERNEVVLRSLLERGADPNEFFGGCEVTPLDIAVDKGEVQCVATLLEFGANPNPVWVNNGDTLLRFSTPVSPLQLASEKNYADIVKVLLYYGAEVNGKETANKEEDEEVSTFDSPLHKAAANNSCGALVELIKAGAVVDIRDARGRTPLLHAAAEAQVSAMKILLEFGADPDARDAYGTTAVLLVGGHFVTSRKNTKRKNTTGYCEALSLLLKHDASADCVDPQTRATPLHQAVTLGDTGAVDVLFERHHVVNCQDVEGVTPLHIAAVKGNAILIRILVQQLHDPINIDLADREGRTAIHKAAFRGSIECIRLLIQLGADLSNTTNEGTSAVTIILELPKGAQYLEEMMNENIECNDVTPSERNFKIHFNYSLLLSNHNKNQTSILNEMLDFPEKRLGGLLEHPLVESFLYLKWQKIKYLYFFNFCAYILFVLGITAIVTLGFCQLTNGEPLGRYRILQYALLAFYIPVTFQEFLQMFAIRRQYFREIESWLKITLLGTSFALLIAETKQDWVLHVSAAAVFFGWAELMMLVGRLPRLGVYALMFSSVAKQIIKFLMAFSFLLIGFAISFRILFKEESFENIFIAIIRTLGMMTGDSSFETHFFPEDVKSRPPPVSSHIIYVLFITLVSIVLMNLLIGLAVSDIHGLLKVGRLRRLRKQARYLIYLETAVYSRVFGIFIPHFFRGRAYSRFKIEKELSYYPSGKFERIGSRNLNCLAFRPKQATTIDHSTERQEERISLPSHIYENAIAICHEKTYNKAISMSDVLAMTIDCKERVLNLAKAVDRMESEFRKVNSILIALAAKNNFEDYSTDA